MLSDKIFLCYVKFADLLSWIENNNLDERSFKAENQKWFKAISREPNFFSDTELLVVYQDILLLQVGNEDHVSFLAKTYKLEYQAICQQLFLAEKNILVVSSQQWKNKKNEEVAVVLFKDKESIKNSLNHWLKMSMVNE